MRACQPHQMIRVSLKRRLDKENIISQSNHLQISTKHEAFIFNCNEETPRLINSSSLIHEWADPHNYTENGFAIYSRVSPNDFERFLETTPQGSTIVERQAKLEAEDKQIEDQDVKVLGLFKTYSNFDLQQIKAMKVSESIDKVDIKVMFAQFGQDNTISALENQYKQLASLSRTIKARNKNTNEGTNEVN